jgi:acyl-CoA thioesterase
MYEFDEDTRVERVGSGSYRGTVTDRWSIGPVPNGGYVLSVGLGALGDVLGRPDPLTVTAHYLKPAAVGPVAIEVEVVKSGRHYATGVARLLQQEREILRVLATYTDLGDASGPTWIDGGPPPLPPLDAPFAARPFERLPTIARRFEIRAAPETMGWLEGRRADRAEIRAWIRFADDRPPDTRSLALFSDAMAPPVFNVIDPGWVPTVELTVHVRARPSSSWLRAIFRTRFVVGGHLEEDGELWDESGQLVAMSRQIAGAPRPR